MIRGPRTTFADQGPASTVTLIFRITRKIFTFGTCHFKIIAKNIQAIFRENVSSLRFYSGKIFKIIMFTRGPRTTYCKWSMSKVEKTETVEGPICRIKPLLNDVFWCLFQLIIQSLVYRQNRHKVVKTSRKMFQLFHSEGNLLPNCFFHSAGVFLKTLMWKGLSKPCLLATTSFSS